MKVKIRGLVFAGFAAAVFAQSAMAVSDSDKTVTSKTYVDSKIEASAGTATTIGPSSDEDKAPSSKNVYLALQEVQTQLNNLQADDVYIDIQNVGSGANAHQEITVNSNARATTVESITDNTAAVAPSNGNPGAPAAQQKLVTASAVNAYAEAKANKLAETTLGTTTITPANATGNDGNTTFPTTRNVYDFVTGGNNPDAGFQRKVATTEAGKVMIGYRKVTGTGSEATYDDATWYSMLAGQQHGLDTVPFVSISKDESNSEVFVDLNHGRIIGSNNISGEGTGYDASGITDQSGNKLATGIAVYNYAAQKDWGIANAGKHLVVGSDGLVALSTNTNPDIPTNMPDECDTESGGHVCALVAYYDATAQGVVYEWTVMAPTGNNG